MKAVVTVLAGVAILAAAFMVYRWQRNDDGERRRAEGAAEQIDAYCRRQGSRCDVVRVEPLSEGFWRLHVRNPGQATKCWRLDLEGFRATERDSVYVGGAIERHPPELLAFGARAPTRDPHPRLQVLP